MGALLKDLYSPSFYECIGGVFAEAVPGFNPNVFIKQIFAGNFETKELKERMRHTVLVLHDFLPAQFPDAVNLLKKAIEKLRENSTGEDGLAYMFLPDYIQVYGIDDYHTSADALEHITQFVSCEFAVRAFLVKYPELMMAKMLSWSKHDNYKVRRLASEGSRLRLPWGLAVSFLKEDARLVLPILENLKADPSEWVRRSVANSLNDMAKDFPEILLQVVKQWSGISKETDALIKHGCRNLLKQGHTEILKHYSLDSHDLLLDNLRTLTPEVKVGNNLAFSFTIANSRSTAQKVRLEYAIYYRKKNGTKYRKVFKISEKDYRAETLENIVREHKFVLITTRTFYTGLHTLGIIVNGEEMAKTDFNLIVE